MTKVGMEYLQANGRFRRTSAATEIQWPNFIINHHDKQAHSMRDSPVFVLERKPRQFADWDSLINAPPPVPDHYPDKLLCVSEDQSIWPLSAQNIVPDVQDMQMQFKEFGLDAEQNGVVTAARESVNQSIVNMWSIVSMAIFGISALLTILVVLQSKAGQDFIGDVNPLAISLSLMGL